VKPSLPNSIFSNSYEEFSRDHDRLRSQLIDALPVADWQSEKVKSASRGRISSPIFAGVKLRFALRPALAAAAVLLIIFGTAFFMDTGKVNPHAAWASALENATLVQSLHCRMNTPGARGNDADVEIWWRRPDNFRMQFSNGLIWTSNGQNRCMYEQKTNKLNITKANGPGMEMFLLGQFGKLFASEYALASEWITNSDITNSERTMYKGEKCLKITATMNNDRYEYFIEEKEDKPLIFEMNQYHPSRGLVCHLEVLEVDKNMEDGLFRIDPEGKKLR